MPSPSLFSITHPVAAMQQTALDRKLRQKLVYYTQIYCNTLPHALPPGVELEETTPEMGSRYLYRITVPTDELLNDVTARLEVENITYTSRVAERTGIRKRVFGGTGDSFTMEIAWGLLLFVVIVLALSGLPGYLWRTLSS